MWVRWVTAVTTVSADISDLTIAGQPHDTPTSLRSGGSLCRRDRAVVTTFGRAGIPPAARPQRHFSDTSPALRPIFAQPYTVTVTACQLVGTCSTQIRGGIDPNSRRVS
jgi:hypothetical protein